MLKKWKGMLVCPEQQASLWGSDDAPASSRAPPDLCGISN